MIQLDLRQRCDGCGQHLSVKHALSCSHGGLVLIRHNDVAMEWGELGKTGLCPSTVSHKPKIYSGEAAKGAKAPCAGSE
eukprot:10448366-Ditylum_brightwellii.AAC.2